jgi:hypothetical protein
MSSGLPSFLRPLQHCEPITGIIRDALCNMPVWVKTVGKTKRPLYISGF